MTAVRIGPVSFAGDAPLAVIAGPCALESYDHARAIAETLAALCADLGIGFVFKASFDKANRTSGRAPRGVGIDAGLEILARLRADVGCPVTTDVHDPRHCAAVAQAVDLLQIPAFLCRQTDLLTAAAETGAAINVKKGQFLAPWDMQAVVDKIAAAGNRRILLTERGTSFGYNALVADMGSLPIMARTGCPVIFDATHSVQAPGGLGGASGGDRAFAPVLARAAVAAGCAGVFIETHDDPDSAPSDGPVMVPLEQMAPLLTQLRALDRLVKPDNT